MNGCRKYAPGFPPDVDLYEDLCIISPSRLAAEMMMEVERKYRRIWMILFLSAIMSAFWTMIICLVFQFA